MHEAGETRRNVVFFDGVCVLCNRTVRFLFARDRHGVLRFAPLEGKTADALFEATEPADRLAGVLYVRDLGGPGEEVFRKSTALLEILHDLGGPWRLLAPLRWLPRFLRDPLYDWIARHRYRWFGKLDTPPIPESDLEERTLP